MTFGIEINNDKEVTMKNLLLLLKMILLLSFVQAELFTWTSVDSQFIRSYRDNLSLT